MTTVAAARSTATLFPKADEFTADLLRIIQVVPQEQFGVLPAQHLTELQNSFNIFKDYVENKFFDTHGPVPANKNALEGGMVPGMQVNDAAFFNLTKKSVFAMSAAYELDEYICLNYLLAFKINPNICEKLEAANTGHKPKGYFTTQSIFRTEVTIQEAMHELYKLERRTMFAGLLKLMKTRVHILDVQNDDYQARETRKQKTGYKEILAMGNELIGNGLRHKLIKEIEKHYVNIQNRVKNNSPALGDKNDYVVTELDELEFLEIQDLSLILFYALCEDDDCFTVLGDKLSYKIIPDLQDIIFKMAQDLMNNSSMLMSIAETRHAWQAPTHKALVVLQLAHATCIELITSYCQDGVGRLNTTVDAKHKREMTKLADDLYKKTREATTQHQFCTAHGTALLAYADVVSNEWVSTYQPDLTIDNVLQKINSGAKKNANGDPLYGQSCMGTYDYLRLCVLPVIQARANNCYEDHMAKYDMKEDSEYLFQAFIGILETIRVNFECNEQLFENSILEMGNLYAATWIIYPSYADGRHSAYCEYTDSGELIGENVGIKVINANNEDYHEFTEKLLHHTVFAHTKGSSKMLGINTVSLYLIQGLATETYAERVYRLLHAPPAAPQSPIFKLSWTNIFEFVKNCEANYGSLKNKHENLLIAVFSLMATVFTRCPRIVGDFLYDYRAVSPITLLFKLVGKPLKIAVKGSIFRALAGLATYTDDPELHTEIWNEIESYRLLPSYGISKDVTEEHMKKLAEKGMVFEVNKRFTNTGLRFELDEVEDKAGMYMITDGFLQLLDVLLSHGSNDDLGREHRPPGISVYVEYVIEDVLLKAPMRTYFSGPQGEAQKWRLIARAIKILSNILQHYEVNSIIEMQAQRASNKEVKDVTLLDSLEDDFGELDEYGKEKRVTYMVNREESFSDQIRRQSAGFMVMTLILANTSKLRDHLLDLLDECKASSIQSSWNLNYDAATNQALKMGEILGQRLRQTSVSVADTRLDFNGFDDGICDSSYWRARCATTTVGLLYECSLREEVFVQYFQVKGVIKMIRIENGIYIHKPYTVHSLSDLLTDSSPAMCSLIMLYRLSNVYCTSVPSVPVMISNMLKKVSSDLLPSAVLYKVKGQTLGLGIGGAPPTDFRDLQLSCLYAMNDDNVLPLRYEEHPVAALGKNSLGLDVYSLEESPWKAPYRQGILLEIDDVMKNHMNDWSLLSRFVTVPEAVLDYLLTTLESNCECLSHHLLGLTEFLNSSYINRWDIFGIDQRLWTLANRNNVAETCLEQLVVLLEDPRSMISEKHRYIYIGICFELMYRLCCSPTSSAIVLSILRIHKVQDEGVLKVCFGSCLSVLTVDLPDIPAGATFKNDITTSCFICVGWLLRIMALELRSLAAQQTTTSQNSYFSSHFDPFLALYRDPFDVDGIPYIQYMYILVHVCEQIQPGNQDQFFPDVNSELANCVQAATTHYYIKRHGVHLEPPEGGPDSYIVIDKHLFSRELAHLVDTSMGGEDMDIDVFISDNESKLLEYNRNCRDVACAEHCIEGWRQCCTILVNCHGDKLLDAYNQVPKPLTDYLQMWLEVIMDTLIRYGDKLSIKILDAVASTLFISVEELSKRHERYAPPGKPFKLITFPYPHSTNTATRQLEHPGLLQISAVDVEYEDIYYVFEKLVKVLLTSVTGFKQPHGAAVFLRGYLYSTLSSLLIDAFGFPNSLNPKYQTQVFNNSTIVRNKFGGDANIDKSLQDRARFLLQQHASELADTLGRDICSAPVLWKLNACAAMNNMLVALGKESIRKPIQMLLERKYLQQVLNIVDTFQDDAVTVTSGHPTFTNDNKAQQELFVSILTLCTHIARTPEGATSLIEYQILQRLNNSPIFNRAPPALDSMGGLPAEELVTHWVTQVLPVLRFLRVLCSTSQSRQVYEGVAAFMLANRDSVLYILRLRIKALTGLVLVECLVNILMMIASAPLVQQQCDTDGNHELICIWDTVFETFGNTMLAELCDILKKIGGDPLPIQLSRSFGVAGVGAFWNYYTNSNIPLGWVHSESHLTSVKLKTGFNMFPNNVDIEWNTFHRIKLDLGLKVTSHISSLLRMRMHSAIEQAFSNTTANSYGGGITSVPAILNVVSSIDMESIVTAFCTTSQLSRKCALHGQIRSVPPLGPDPEIGLYMYPLLNSSAENLITALHDMTVSKCDWQPRWLSAVLTEAEVEGVVPTERTYINDLGRVIKSHTQQP